MPGRARVVGAVVVLILGAAAFVFLSDRGGEVRAARELVREQLELKDGDVLYVRGETAPFDGVMVENYSEGVRKVAIEVRGGKPHGVSRGYYESGQMEVEEHFVDGVSHGERVRWFESGAKKSQAQIIDGKIEGVFVRWYENGQKEAEVNMVNGKPDGLSEAWHPSGKPKSRVEMKEGKVIKQEFWDEEGNSE